MISSVCTRAARPLFSTSRLLSNIAMAFTLPSLPYPRNALQPHISEETVDFHYGKHHASYVSKVNELTKDKPEAKMSLEELIMAQSKPVFNPAAQAWNHTFYWHSMAPNAQGPRIPTGKVADLIEKSFGSFDNFKAKFTTTAATHFGSGWAWLVQKPDGLLDVVSTHDAGNPLTDKLKPILTCDVWEHAYYIDQRNARPKYIEAWWNLVNWDFANANLN